MTSNLDRRLARLEAIEAPPLRQRYVWLSRPDEPVPEAEPGEQIVVVHWLWGEEQHAEISRWASGEAAVRRERCRA